jgi:hypothetical protein
MQKITQGKQRKTEYSTPEIGIMANAVRESPIHPWKQIERFGDMGEYDEHQASRTD